MLLRLLSFLFPALGLAAAPAAKRPMDCSGGPHCVSSLQPVKDARYLEPIAYSGTRAEARARLLELLRSLPRVRVEEEGEDRVHAVFASRLFRYKDDVDFYFPRAEKVIHFRSSSRVGYYDFGANRRRMERIRARFLQ